MQYDKPATGPSGGYRTLGTYYTGTQSDATFLSTPAGIQPIIVTAGFGTLGYDTTNGTDARRGFTLSTAYPGYY